MLYHPGKFPCCGRVLDGPVYYRDGEKQCTCCYYRHPSMGDPLGVLRREKKERYRRVNDISYRFELMDFE